MNTKLASLVAALALGLGGCATDPGMGGMVYRDGGYYAPARDGYGDYYIAPDYSDDWADGGYYDPFYGPFYDPFVFGPNWYGGGGGYCPARYRYCPAGWYDGFGSAYYGGGGFGTGFWLSVGGRGGYYDPWAYRDQPDAWRPPHHRHPAPAQDTQSPDWRSPTDAAVGLADADADADGRDGVAPESGADGRFSDRRGDGRFDQRLLRRGLIRQQPTRAPISIGNRLPPPNAGWTDRSGRSERSGGGGSGSERSGGSGERSGGGERASSSDEGGGATRARRRDRGD